MARLIQLSNISWQQRFKDRKKELMLWGSHSKVAEFCNFEDGTKRRLNIKFESRFKINYTDDFQITSGNEILFPKEFREQIADIILNNSDSYFTVTVVDTSDISFSPSDIIWIKNVKRDGGKAWAYDDVSCKKNFLLHWSTKMKGSARTPKVGDIIVLFQKPNKINGRRNYHVHLTHLVTPVSAEIIPDEDNPNYKWCREVQLIAIANPIQAIPNPGHFDFFLPNRGLTNPIVNLESRLKLSEAGTQEELWKLFEKHFCANIKSKIFKPKDPVGIFGEPEGDKVIKEHIKQEITRRNSKIVQRKKSEALREGNSKILCECCDFDFYHQYGDHGTGFIECHHKIHVSIGKRITQLEDLALVCANCHRMLHHKKDDKGYYTVEELRELIERVNTKSKR
jgi:hypothetical protein